MITKKNKFELGQEVFVSFTRGNVTLWFVRGMEQKDSGEILYLLHNGVDETSVFENNVFSSRNEALRSRYLSDKTKLQAELKQLTEELDMIDAVLEALK